jgi:hypothetical protein
MNHHWHFWDELLRATEESYAAFSGVSPDLIGDSRAIPKTRHPDSNREVAVRRRLRRSAEASALRSTVAKSKTGGEDR